MKSKKILVTGASRGIGQAIAIQLAKEGYSLLLHARTKEHLTETIQKINDDTTTHIITADFLKIEEVKAFLTILKKEHKDLFGIVSNAGITFDKPIAYQPEKEIDSILQVNLKVPILLGKLAMKLFLKNKTGVFIHMASVVGEMGNAFQSIYASTKAGVVALSKSWAREISTLEPDHKARFLSVSPGFIQTNMTDKLDKNIQAHYKSTIPSKRFGTPQEVAHLISFLISDQSPYINGSEVKINGGIL